MSLKNNLPAESCPYPGPSHYKVRSQWLTEVTMEFLLNIFLGGTNVLYCKFLGEIHQLTLFTLPGTHHVDLKFMLHWALNVPTHTQKLVLRLVKKSNNWMREVKGIYGFLLRVSGGRVVGPVGLKAGFRCSLHRKLVIERMRHIFNIFLLRYLLTVGWSKFRFFL